jgi:SAM-dependent methyltransferase
VGERREALRLTFGSEAELYDRARPSYPPEAARWLLGDAPLRVIDLAAGTGIFTRQLLELGHDVVAVEPDDAMRAVLAARTAGVTVVEGEAESIPLPDGSADAVVAAQAHWWFDEPRAYPEIARVLGPGGVFGALWNAPDVSVPWAAELARIEARGLELAVDPPHPGASFGPPAHATFRHSVVQTPAAVLDLVRSRGYFIAAAPAVRRSIGADVAALTSSLPPTFELPYVTFACRARRGG